MQNMRRRYPPASASRGSASADANMAYNGHHELPPPAMRGRETSGGASGSGTRRATAHAEALDASSCKGIFGWASVDGVNIPYILRNKAKFVSVRMVELKLLSKYPSTYPEELKDRAPLTSQFITVNEAKLLNEINAQHCSFEYGHQGFDVQDLIVALTDFEEFYNIVKRNFPGDASQENEGANEKPPKHTSAGAGTDGGWIQVNNTIVPFLIRKSIKLVPLPVIRYGANLLNNVQVSGLDCTEKELVYLNHNCKEVGLDFTFSKATTKLIEISLIPSLSEEKPTITELPKDDPFGHATYRSDDEIQQPPSANYPSAMEGFPRAAASFIPRGANQGALPPRVGPMLRGPVPDRLPMGSATIAKPPEATNMQWIGSHVGTYAGVPPRGPPPPYPQGHASPHSAHSVASSKLPPGRIASSAPGPSHSPQQQQLLPSNHPALSPSTVAKPPTNGELALDLSAKSPPIPIVVQPHTDARSSPIWQTTAGKIPGTNRGSLPRPHPDRRGTSDVIQNRRKQISHPQRTSTGQSRSNVIRLKDGRTIELQSTSFHGKGITCIVKDGDGYALLESLNRMFFPKCTLEAFTRGLRDVLKLEIKELTDEEEQAFISHYELRIRNLRCTKVVSLGAMDLNMTQMKFMFNGEDAEVVGNVQKAQNASPKPAEQDDQDTNNNNGITAPQDPEAQANHRAACQALKDFIGKRTAPSEVDCETPPEKRAKQAVTPPRPAKHSTGKLENIMNKLKKAQMKPNEGSETPSEEKDTTSSQGDIDDRQSGDESFSQAHDDSDNQKVSDDDEIRNDISKKGIVPQEEDATEACTPPREDFADVPENANVENAPMDDQAKPERKVSEQRNGVCDDASGDIKSEVKTHTISMAVSETTQGASEDENCSVEDMDAENTADVTPETSDIPSEGTFITTDGNSGVNEVIKSDQILHDAQPDMETEGIKNLSDAEESSQQGDMDKENCFDSKVLTSNKDVELQECDDRDGCDNSVTACNKDLSEVPRNTTDIAIDTDNNIEYPTDNIPMEDQEKKDLPLGCKLSDTEQLSNTGSVEEGEEQHSINKETDKNSTEPKLDVSHNGGANLETFKSDMPDEFDQENRKEVTPDDTEKDEEKQDTKNTQVKALDKQIDEKINDNSDTNTSAINEGDCNTDIKEDIDLHNDCVEESTPHLDACKREITTNEATYTNESQNQRNCKEDNEPECQNQSAEEEVKSGSATKVCASHMNGENSASKDYDEGPHKSLENIENMA